MLFSLYLLAICLVVLVVVPLGPGPAIGALIAFVALFMWGTFALEKRGRSLCPAPIVNWLKRGPFLIKVPAFICCGFILLSTMTIGIVIACEEALGRPFPGGGADLTTLEGLARLF